MEKPTSLYHEQKSVEIKNFGNFDLEYFKEHPDAKLSNMVFGELNKYEWYLLERKHLNHQNYIQAQVILIKYPLSRVKVIIVLHHRPFGLQNKHQNLYG